MTVLVFTVRPKAAAATISTMKAKATAVRNASVAAIMAAALINPTAHADVSCSAPCTVKSPTQGTVKSPTQGDQRVASQSTMTGHQPVGSTCWVVGEGCEQNYDNNIQSSTSNINQVGGVMDDDQMQDAYTTGPLIDGSVMLQHIAGGTPQRNCGGYNYPC